MCIFAIPLIVPPSHTMIRYFIHLAYDGTAYHGWQMQPNGVSVQQVITEALSLVLRHPVIITGAGRTDTGVHARQFYAHVDIEMFLSTDQCNKLVFNLNALLPKGIAIYEIFPVSSESHARFSAISRTYEYIICQRKDPFLVNRAWFNSQQLDIELMNQGAAILLEYDDFACFSKSHTQVKTTNCHISHAAWEGDAHILKFTITADRFLRNMVRAIVGTLIELGRRKITIDDLKRIIESGDRRLAGYSVPAHGLYLREIKYPESIRLKNDIDT